MSTVILAHIFKLGLSRVRVDGIISTKDNRGKIHQDTHREISMPLMDLSSPVEKERRKSRMMLDTSRYVSDNNTSQVTPQSPPSSSQKLNFPRVKTSTRDT